MRKTLVAPLVALLILALSAASVAAVVVTNISRDCIDDDQAGGRFITGTVTVEDGSFADGDTLTLELYGKIRGVETLLDTETITLEEGVLEYDYTFSNVPTQNGSGTLYQSYIIKTDAENPEKSESIDVEQECNPGVIPEAPMALLLVGTAIAGAGWFVMRRTRARSLPLAA